MHNVIKFLCVLWCITHVNGVHAMSNDKPVLVVHKEHVANGLCKSTGISSVTRMGKVALVVGLGVTVHELLQGRQEKAVCALLAMVPIAHALYQSHTATTQKP